MNTRPLHGLPLRGLAAVALLCLAGPLAAQLRPGSNAATPQIEQSFVNAYSRGTFALAAPVTLTNVRSLSGASPALVQEFGATGATSQTTVRSALVKPDPNAPVSANDTLQVLSDIYSSYSSQAANAGLPLADTQACPANSYGTCNYQIFSKNTAYFAYSTPVTSTALLSDPVYTEWTARGGIGGALGPATASLATVTSQNGTSGGYQPFAGGAVFSYTVSGQVQTYSVSGPIFSAFQSNGLYGVLGFPTSAEITLTSGVRRQTFEAARVEFTPGQTAAVVYFPLTNLDIIGASFGLTLNAGATSVISAAALDSRNNTITDRVFTWSTSNGAVVTVTGNGASATVRGVATGTANIYVSAEGKTSPPMAVTVRGVCCGIGEGAPTAAISQAFQAAATRNRLSVALPGANGVTRTGAGYTQLLTAADGSGAVFVIAQSDRSTTAYVMSGAVYSAYLELGGFTGNLGYPAADAAGGAQSFESGSVLAGMPVRLIPAVIARRWLGGGGIAGTLGAPAAAAAAFLSSGSGSAGLTQTFAGGTIFAYTSGLRNSQAYLSSGPILARYLELSGPGGALGGPSSELVTAGPIQSQDFENGFIELQGGVATERINPRRPAVTAQPATIAPGGRTRITVSGFAPGSAIAVTVGAQQPFSVSPASGSFSWDVTAPLSARPGTVSIQARGGATDTASGSYAVVNAASLLPRWSLISGDRQSAAPGALLSQPLVALLADSEGAPMPGVPVTVTGSPGAVLQAPAATGPDGRIAVRVRLPALAGAAVLSLNAAGQVVTASAIATGVSVTGYPAFSVADSTVLADGPATFAQQGSLLFTLAGLVRYRQNNGLAPTPNGLATPLTLNNFLKSRSGFAAAAGGSPIVNPWVAALFAGPSAGVDAVPASLEGIRDWLSSGSPAGVVLNLFADGVAAGSTTVAAVGIDSSGNVQVSDPNPLFARTGLSDYLAGFISQGRRITGVPAVMIRVTTGALPSGFVAAGAATSGLDLRSPVGSCPGIELAEAGLPSGVPAAVRFFACDGTQDIYEAALRQNPGFSIADLGSGLAVTTPAGPGLSYSVRRLSGQLQVTAQSLGISAVVDSAAFGPALAPGGIASIFGTGFRPEADVAPVVSINGQAVSLLASLPFQINMQIPPGLTAGQAVVQVRTALGVVEKTVTIGAAAPSIFVIGANTGGGPQGAVVNQDGTINSDVLPATRGQVISIYCTGLGATAVRNGLAFATVQPTVLVNGTTLTPAFAGLAPGFIGLYQVNVTVPVSVYPGAASTLRLQQSGLASNTVAFALQ